MKHLSKLNRLSKRVVVAFATGFATGFVTIFVLGAFGLGLANEALARAESIEAIDKDRLRVCADPSNLPFSNEKGEGIENKIAELLAQWLNKELVYEYFPQAIGFVRNTLIKKKCDVVIGITGSNELVLNTNPYYRWGYVIVYPKDSGIKVDRPDHPQLAELRIGAVAGAPTNFVLKRYNLMARVRPYQLRVDTRVHSVGRQMIQDMQKGIIDIAYMSAPIAAFHAKQEGLEVEMVRLETTDQGYGKMDYLMTMGVRPNENDWKRTINRFLREKKKEINAIFAEAGFPTLPIRQTKKRKPAKS